MFHWSSVKAFFLQRSNRRNTRSKPGSKLFPKFLESLLTINSRNNDDLTKYVETVYRLKRIEEEDDIKDKIIKWAKRGAIFLSLFGLIVGIVSIVGIRAYVESMAREEFENAIKAASKAESAAQEANSAAIEAMNATKKAKEEAESYKKTVEDLRVQGGELDSSFFQLKQKLQAESSHSIATANLQVSSLNDRLVQLERLVPQIAQQLERLVPQIAQQNEQLKGLLTSYSSELQSLQQEAKRKQAAFADYSKYWITINKYGKSKKANQIFEKLNNRLINLGFKVSTRITPQSVNSDEYVEILYATDEDKRYSQKIEDTIRKIIKEENFNPPKISSTQTPISGDNNVIINLYNI